MATIDSGVGIEYQIPQTQADRRPALRPGRHLERPTVYENDVAVHPCAFLHNYCRPGALDEDLYAHWLEQAPTSTTGGRELCCGYSLL